MSISPGFRAAIYTSALAGYLLAGTCVAMEKQDVRVELTGSGSIDMSKIQGKSISLYGVYIGQPQDDTAKALAKHKMIFDPTSKEQMTQDGIDPKYQDWFINEPNFTIFAGMFVRLK